MISGNPLQVVRRLPRTVKPFPNEVVFSYLHRLEQINCFPKGLLLSLSISEDRRQTALLSTLSGYSAPVLRCALPELDAKTTRLLPGHWYTYAPCYRCVARRAPGQTVNAWHAHQARFCPRHRVWTGNMRYPLHTDRRPDISRAHHRYGRLVAQYGAAPTHTAFRDAVEIITSWSTMNVLNLPPDQALDPAPSAIEGPVSPREIWSTRMAAHCYPATVELTRLLVDAAWTDQALASRAWADVRPAFAHLVSDTYRPEGMSDPLTLWRNDIRQRRLISAAHVP